MDSIFVARGTADAIPIWFVTRGELSGCAQTHRRGGRAFADAAGFEPKPGRHLLLPGKNGPRRRSVRA